jgi:hypothetical protein
MGMTAQQLFEGIGGSERFSGRIHWAAGTRFAGVPGHLYVYRHARHIEPRHLAAISHASGDVEVCLMRFDGIPVIYVGARAMAVATVFVPDRSSGLETFEWVAHTHPLEMESAAEGVARGATPADRRALETIHDRWGQTESTVIVCRAGRVLRVVPFRIERDARIAPGTGRLWHPGD